MPLLDFFSKKCCAVCTDTNDSAPMLPAGGVPVQRRSGRRSVHFNHLVATASFEPDCGTVAVLRGAAPFARGAGSHVARARTFADATVLFTLPADTRSESTIRFEFRF